MDFKAYESYLNSSLKKCCTKPFSALSMYGNGIHVDKGMTILNVGSLLVKLNCEQVHSTFCISIIVLNCRIDFCVFSFMRCFYFFSCRSVPHGSSCSFSLFFRCSVLIAIRYEIGIIIYICTRSRRNVMQLSNYFKRCRISPLFRGFRNRSLFSLSLDDDRCRFPILFSFSSLILLLF